MKAKIRDTEIFFDVDGAGLVPDGPSMRAKPSAFLFHGGPGGDHSGYKTCCAPLRDTMQLVYFDYRGSGRSARGDEDKYSLDENVEDVEALRKYLGLERIVSIGGSFGGMVAMAHAARYPSSVSHLILVVTAAHCGYIDRAKEIVGKRGTSEQIEQVDALFGGDLDTVEAMATYFRVMASLYSWKYDAAKQNSKLGRAVRSPEASNRGVAPDGYLRTFDLRPELSAIRAPTLILGARHDWICAPEFSEEIHKLIPGSDLRIFENSGHALMTDEQEPFLNAVRGFLAYNEGGKSA